MNADAKAEPAPSASALDALRARFAGHLGSGAEFDAICEIVNAILDERGVKAAPAPETKHPAHKETASQAHAKPHHDEKRR